MTVRDTGQRGHPSLSRCSGATIIRGFNDRSLLLFVIEGFHHAAGIGCSIHHPPHDLEEDEAVKKKELLNVSYYCSRTFLFCGVVTWAWRTLDFPSCRWHSPSTHCSYTKMQQNVAEEKTHFTGINSVYWLFSMSPAVIVRPWITYVHLVIKIGGSSFHARNIFVCFTHGLVTFMYLIYFGLLAQSQNAISLNTFLCRCTDLLNTECSKIHTHRWWEKIGWQAGKHFI